jgi:8-oxo-dGTP pyrophosphatase MutT (NUDIX family)
VTTVRKVRVVLTDEHGRTYMITGRQNHVLQLPGGSVKPGEGLRRAIRREIREETGFTVKILSATPPIAVRRSRHLTEITTCFHAVITGRAGKPAFTGREAGRGLTVTRFKSTDAALTALDRRARRYGRTAVRRDLMLATTIIGWSGRPTAAHLTALARAITGARPETPADVVLLLGQMHRFTRAAAALLDGAADTTQTGLRRHGRGHAKQAAKPMREAAAEMSAASRQVREALTQMRRYR